jgi:hypothetical protein
MMIAPLSPFTERMPPFDRLRRQVRGSTALKGKNVEQPP